MAFENFLGEVLAKTDGAILDQFREAVSLLNDKVSSLKSEFTVSLEKSFGTLDLDINHVSSWFHEIAGANKEVDDISKQLSEEEFTQNVSSEELTFVKEEIIVCDRNIRILRNMVDVVQNLESTEPSDIFMAAQRLRKAKDCLKSVVNEFDEVDFKRVDWVRGLQSSICARIDETYEFAMNEWDTKFQFQHNTLVVDPEIGKCDIPNLIDAMDNLNYYPTQCERFCLEVWQVLLSKASTPDYTVKITFPNKKNSKTPMLVADIPVRDTDPVSSPDQIHDAAAVYGSHNAVLMHVKKLDLPITDIGIVFKNIIRLVVQLNDIFSKKVDVMHDMAEILGPKLISQLSSKCLKSLILQESKGSKEKARQNILQLHEFREMLKELNFLIPDDHEAVFDEFESNFEMLFTRQLREDTLARVRVLIKSNLHHTIETTPDDVSIYTDSNSDEAILHKNPYERQIFTISRSIADMVELLQEYSANHPSDLLLISHAFNIFLSIVNIPKHDIDSKDFIPLSAVLVHNNCMFLAHHATTTFPNCEVHIPMLRTKATQAFTFMMKSIRTHLNGMISEAMTALDEESETAKRKREHKLLSIASEFEKLNGVFKEVLPPRPWREALGTIVDHTLNEICSKVLACEDISANTGNDLANAFTKFAVETSMVFKKPGLSSREVEAVSAKLVPKWHRFRLLTFILTASMRDIEDKWVNGCGPLSMVFTAEEVRKLVRALFQNTEHRSAFLATIK